MKCLDIVCEIQRAVFLRQFAMFLNGDKMMKLFKLRLHLLTQGSKLKKIIHRNLRVIPKI